MGRGKSCQKHFVPITAKEMVVDTVPESLALSRPRFLSDKSDMEVFSTFDMTSTPLQSASQPDRTFHTHQSYMQERAPAGPSMTCRPQPE